MDWVRILAYITGTVDLELLLRNEYLAAENRILKAQLKTPLRLTDAERVTLAEIAHRLGRKVLEDVANAAKPDTIMGWYRRLIARKFDGSKSRRYPGRPRLDNEIEQLVVRMAKENSAWGYDRIVGAMANLGYTLSDQTVGNILQRHGIPPAPEHKRSTSSIKRCSRTYISYLFFLEIIPNHLISGTVATSKGLSTPLRFRKSY